MQWEQTEKKGLTETNQRSITTHTMYLFAFK